MKILPINTINLQQPKKANNSENFLEHSDQKATVLPKAIEIKQNLSNPTFKDCGLEYAAGRGACSLLGIT